MRGERYLTKREQFAIVYNKGASWVDKVVVMKTLRNGLATTRCGFSVSSRVGGAVVRNRVKRRLREIVRSIPLKSGWDIVIIARPAAARADFLLLNNDVGKLLTKAQLIGPDRGKEELVGNA
jgi:ribonuclease P protein component